MTTKTTDTFPFRTIGEVRKACDDSGSHWFDAGAMRFFGTRLRNDSDVHAGRVFVASHQPPTGPRVYGCHLVTVTTTTRDDGREVTRYGVETIGDLAESVTSPYRGRKVAEYVATFVGMTGGISDDPDMSERDRLAGHVAAFRDARGW